MPGWHSICNQHFAPDKLVPLVFSLELCTKAPENLLDGGPFKNRHNQLQLITEVIFHQASGQLELAWQDLSRRVFSGEFLRRHCKCSGCEQQRRNTPLLDQNPSLAGSTKILSISPVASVGLNISFDDQHNRGIYPWEYFQELKSLH
jgi:DUF971 family protein